MLAWTKNCHIFAHIVGTLKKNVNVCVYMYTHRFYKITHHAALRPGAAHNDQCTPTSHSGAFRRPAGTCCEKPPPCPRGNLCSRISCQAHPAFKASSNLLDWFVRMPSHSPLGISTACVLTEKVIGCSPAGNAATLHGYSNTWQAIKLVVS